MNILVISQFMPSTFSGGSITLYYDLTYLKQREHRITLVALEENGADSMHRQEPSSYCDELIKIDMPPAGTWLKKYHIIRNMLSFVHLRSNSHTFLNPAYSPQMQLKINELVKNNKFDVIYVYSLYTAYYVWDINLPKVVYTLDFMPEHAKNMAKKARNPALKLGFWLYYYTTLRETKYLSRKQFYAAMVAAGGKDINEFNKLLPGFNIVPLTWGPDIDYFKPVTIKPDEDSLIFVGPMRTDAILFFCTDIYPLIKISCPKVKFYVIGAQETTLINALSNDKSVVFTGFVEDIRPYVARSSVVVTPMRHHMGISNKILEAMAMAKPVVSTSICAGGLEVTPGEDIFIADEPQDFADKVCLLLHDKELADCMGRKAREKAEKQGGMQKRLLIVEQTLSNASVRK